VATKDEIIRGIEQLIQESHRVAHDLRPGDWEQVVDLDGWKNQEVLAHIAGVGGMVQPLAGGIANAAPGADAIAGVNIDQLNASIVAARAGKQPKELAAEIETSYRGVIEFVKNAPDDLLAKKATAGGYVDVPVGDIIIRMVVLHGLAHIYSVYSSIFTRAT
jgi:hypothetical protein